MEPCFADGDCPDPLFCNADDMCDYYDLPNGYGCEVSIYSRILQNKLDYGEYRYM